MCFSPFRHSTTVRLACFSHAASVRSEPGSNSSLDYRPAFPGAELAALEAPMRARLRLLEGRSLEPRPFGLWSMEGLMLLAGAV